MSYKLTIVDCIGEINLIQREKTLKIETLNSIDTKYELLLTFENTSKIYYCKFDTSNVLSSKEPQQENANNQNPISQTKFKVLLWVSKLSLLINNLIVFYNIFFNICIPFFQKKYTHIKKIGV